MQAQHTIFYFTEKAIKRYRRFAQARIKQHYTDVTIDQLLVLEKLTISPDISYNELSEYIFKDSASVSRMLTLLEKNLYISRVSDVDNRRRFKTTVTDKGIRILEDLRPLIIENRKKALKGISDKEIEICKKVLSKLADNLTPIT